MAPFGLLQRVGGARCCISSPRWLVFIALLLCSVQARSQSSVGYSEYFILGDEADLIAAYIGMPGTLVPGTATAANITSVSEPPRKACFLLSRSARSSAKL